MFARFAFVFAIMVFAQLAAPDSSHALTCIPRIQLILKCEKGNCAEGFLVGKKLLHDWCRQTFDTTKQEPVVKFDGNLSNFAEVPSIPHGIYSIETQGHFAYRSPSDRHHGVYTETASGALSYVVRKDSRVTPKMVKLPYPDDIKLQAVIEDYAKQAADQRFWFHVQGFIYPSICLLFFASAFTSFGKRHTGKYIFGFLILSVPIILIFLRRSTMISALVCLILAIVWFVLFFVRRWKNRRRSATGGLN